MKKVIEINEISLPDKNLFDRTSYPDSGCYHVEQDKGNYFFVDSSTVWSVPAYAVIETLIEERDEQPHKDDSIKNALQVIAVALKPELIIELQK
jgi:hypothetical protein